MPKPGLLVKLASEHPSCQDYPARVIILIYILKALFIFSLRARLSQCPARGIKAQCFSRRRDGKEERASDSRMYILG